LAVNTIVFEHLRRARVDPLYLPADLAHVHFRHQDRFALAHHIYHSITTVFFGKGKMVTSWMSPALIPWARAMATAWRAERATEP